MCVISPVPAAPGLTNTRDGVFLNLVPASENTCIPPTAGNPPPHRPVLRIPGHVPSAARPPGPAVWSSFLGTAHSPPGSSGTGVGSVPSPPSTVHGDISMALIGPEALGGKGWMGMWEKGRRAWRGSEVNSLFLQEQV